MNYSMFVAIGSRVSRPSYLRGLAFCALPSILMLVLSLSFTARQVRAQCGSLSAPSTTWSDGNGSWAVAGNWTNGAPNGNNACVLDGTSTVTVDTGTGGILAFQLASGNTLNINPGASLTLNNGFGPQPAISSNFGTITNNGTISVYLDFEVLINKSGGHLTNNGTINLLFGPGLTNYSGGYITNNGTIYGDSAFLDNYGTFINNSVISNFLDVDGGEFVNTGYFANSGTITLQDSLPFTNSGTFNNSGTINLSLNSAGGPSTPFTNSGTLNNSGTMSINYGSPIVGASPVFISNSGTLNNSGILNLTGQGAGGVINSGMLNNAGTITNSGAFTNSGAVLISSGGLFTTSTNYAQTAGSTLVNGKLTATGGALVDIQAGVLGGTGTINGNVLMAGTMMPGDAPGTLTIIGNYEQTGTGIFDEQMSPYSHAFLDVSGNVVLDPGALLEITLLNGYDPLGQTISIMDFSTLSGQFANGSSFWDDNFLWDITYRQHEIDVTAVQAPEPSSSLLLFFGLTALAVSAHRKISKTPRPA